MGCEDGLDEKGDWAERHATQRGLAVGAAKRAAGVMAYGDAWKKAGIDASDISAENWTSLPLLSKDILLDDARRALPFGNRLAVDRSALAHVFVAPGPLYMPLTAADFTRMAGSFAQAFRSCGLTRGDLVDQTTMYNWVIAASVFDRALAMAGCAVVPGGVGQTGRHIEAISHLGINAIVAFPTFLEHLLQEAAAAGTKLPLEKAVVMGELSNRGLKDRIRREHGIVVREFYGVADAGAIAWECEAGQGMHLRGDVLIEFVAPGTSDPAEPAPGSPAEIVVTDPAREAFPIIRLRTGDLVDTIEHGACACGRSSPRIGRIVGRASEITKVKGMFVVPRQVSDVLQRNGLDRRFRIIVERPDGGRDELALEIEGDPVGDAPTLGRQFEEALRLRVDLRFVSFIPEGSPRLDDRRTEKSS